MAKSEAWLVRVLEARCAALAWFDRFDERHGEELGMLILMPFLAVIAAVDKVKSVPQLVRQRWYEFLAEMDSVPPSSEPTNRPPDPKETG